MCNRRLHSISRREFWDQIQAIYRRRPYPDNIDLTIWNLQHGAVSLWACQKRDEIGADRPITSDHPSLLDETIGQSNPLLVRNLLNFHLLDFELFSIGATEQVKPPLVSGKFDVRRGTDDGILN